MIPLRDDVPSERLPIVTYGIIGLNLLVFLWELSLGPALTRTVRLLGVTPLALVGGWRDSPWVFITLLTSQFLHAGWVHLFGNMLYLWIFGDNVEDTMGRGRFLAFYLICGVVANLAQVAINPRSTLPLIGASGAIAGVLGAYLLLFPWARVLVAVPIFFYLRIIAVPAVLVLGTWFVTQLFSGLAAITLASQVTGGVAWWAHVGGFVTGMILIRFFRRRRRPPFVYYL
ncbi:MAG TPA: rhomboid family intramembrane serine protease [Chloroflexi bacterium]|nr:rhomboid family intramembrane serine protease [Chloroflexota bacterium]